MSYPGYHQPDFLESIAKGLQIRSYIDNIKAQREARAQAAELHRLQIEQHQANNARQNFDTTMMLQDIGAIPAAASDTGQNDEAIAQAVNITPENRRPLMTTPVGRYRMPSQSDRYARAERNAQQTGRLKGMQTQAEQEVTDPNVDLAIPTDLGGGTAKVPKTKQLDYLLKIQDALQKQHPDLKVTYADDEQGNRTYFGFDPSTETVKPLKTFTGVAKPQRAVGGKSGLSTAAQRAMQHAQSLIDEATPETDPKATGGLFGTGRSQDERWKAAHAAVAQAVAAYPDELTGGPGKGGYPFILPKGQQAQTKGAATVGGNKTVAASKLGMLLQSEVAKKRGIKDINALRKDLMKNGYTIDDSQ